MDCFGRDRDKDRKSNTGCFERSSPALQQVLLKLLRAENPVDIDHHLYEFGSVEYHVESSASDPGYIYLSVSTPILSARTLVSNGLCPYTKEKVKEICPSVIDIIIPAREGYQLTLRLNIAHIPQGKAVAQWIANISFLIRKVPVVDRNMDPAVENDIKIVREIAAVESVILSSQLKEMLRNFFFEDASQGTYKPIKLTYQPREPIFVIRQPHKLTVVFPMRFKETSDVIIASSFFQELMDISNSETWAKAPPCTWSPIPPSELKGEPIEDLSTNGGFVSFDIFSRHVDEKRIDKTVWNLLNFYAYVKSQIKSTKGFIQRKMRKRLDSLVNILYQPIVDEDEHEQKVQGCGWPVKQIRLPRFRKVRKRYGNINKKINRIRYRIRIHGFSELNKKIKRIHQQIKIRGFSQFRRRWFSMPRFQTAKGYTRLE